MASSARIDELLKKFDENPRRYFAPLANEYRKAGDLEQAIFICQEYLPQQPGHMSGHIVYGQALFELNRHEEAKTVFETALSLDPENLIALRHLGDIARVAGDSANARIWYQRVLEADPRNEEIAQLMLALLAPPAGETAAPPTSAPVDHNAPTPLSNPAIPLDNSSQGFAVEKAPDENALAEPAVAPEPVAPVEAAPPAPVAPPEPKSYASRHAPKEEELLDLDSFDLGGVPLSTLRVSAAEAHAHDQGEAPAPEFSAPMIETSMELSMDAPASAATDETTALDEPFEADPFAIAATPAVASSEPQPEPPTLDAPVETPAPPIELASDIALGLPDEGAAPSFTTEGESLDGLETFEAGIIADKPADESSLIESSSFFDLPSEPVAAPESSIAESSTPESLIEEEPASAPAEAFVTETMATLYLQQGHLDSALDIYRKLVELRPDDHALRSRMDTVEAQVNGATQSAEAPAEEFEALHEMSSTDFETPIATETQAPPARTYGGPTIREFLASIVSRRKPTLDDEPMVATEASSATYEEAESFEAEPEAVAEEPSSEPEEAPVPTPVMRATPSSTETVSGSLGVLFSGADASENDDRAAKTLAEAFAPDSPETTPLQGVPAHRASSELSLNHVFKATPQRNASVGDDFSFDQFFTEEASATEAGEGADSASSESGEGADDIAQFNAWLNGLKKT